jgi:hypothetical protein
VSTVVVKLGPASLTEAKACPERPRSSGKSLALPSTSLQTDHHQ